MTISSSTSKNQYVATGGTGYDYTFKIFQDSDLRVFTTDPGTGADTELALNSDFTVSGAGDQNGGRVSLAAAPPAGYTVTVLRSVAYTQEVDLVDNDPFHAETVEGALDRLTMLAQQLLEASERTVRLSPTSQAAPEDVVLPEPDPGKALGWDTTGALGNMASPGGVVVSSFMETVLDDSTASSARGTLGVYGTSEVYTKAEVEERIKVNLLPNSLFGVWSRSGLAQGSTGRQTDYEQGSAIYDETGEAADDSGNWVQSQCTMARTNVPGGGAGGSNYYYTITQTGGATQWVNPNPPPKSRQSSVRGSEMYF
ncbi:MAG: hypothetical protein AB1896_23095 [Thermodesulfobacteriota bacterium]